MACWIGCYINDWFLGECFCEGVFILSISNKPENTGLFSLLASCFYDFQLFTAYFDYDYYPLVVLLWHVPLLCVRCDLVLFCS